MLASILISVLFLSVHHQIAPSAAPDMSFLRDPNALPTAEMGWWAWWDQGLYQRAALSWANGVVDPKFHWYLPGYPLLAAPFVHLTPTDPFLVPDLACFLGALWLYCGLASRLLWDVPFRIPIACLLFVATSALTPLVLWSWVVPWTTTPETLCLFGALYAAMAVVEGGGRRAAFWTGLATVAIAGFRPVDALLTGLVILAILGPALLLDRRKLSSNLLAGLAGALVPALVFGGAYLATWGPHLSDYLSLSNRIGFEPRLLALRWVMLMIDPRPLLADGRGLAEVFAWIVPGVMGMTATLVTAPRTKFLLNLVVITLVASDIVMFLIFRDLHVTGLWKHSNYHYFKWTLPIFALYAFRLLILLFDRTSRWVVVGSSLVIPSLFCWRAGSLPIGSLPLDHDDRTVTVGSGLTPIDTMIVVPVAGQATSEIVSGGAVTASGIMLRYGYDFVVYASQDVMRVVPIRPLPPERTTFRFLEGVPIDRTLAPTVARQTITWGLPFPVWHASFIR